MNLFRNNMKALVDKKYLLERIPGKYGWTYAAIPEILQSKNKPFGWVRVKGSIDDYEIRAHHLMPMGNGKLFLPVKTEIRKKIHKQADDWVHVILYADDAPIDTPQELLDCLQEDKKILEAFLNLSDAVKKTEIEFIYSAKKEETKVKRIAELINKLAK